MLVLTTGQRIADRKNFNVARSHIIPILKIGQRITDSKKNGGQVKVDKMRVIISMGSLLTVLVMRKSVLIFCTGRGVGRSSPGVFFCMFLSSMYGGTYYRSWLWWTFVAGHVLRCVTMVVLLSMLPRSFLIL